MSINKICTPFFLYVHTHTHTCSINMCRLSCPCRLWLLLFFGFNLLFFVAKVRTNCIGSQIGPFFPPSKRYRSWISSPACCVAPGVSWFQNAMGDEICVGDSLLAKGAWIAHRLYKHCFLPDQGARLKKTAAISPGTSLKHVEARKAFEWAQHVGHQKKFFTLAACRKGVELFLLKEKVEVSYVGLPQSMWVESQAKVITWASLRFLSYHQSKLMADWSDACIDNQDSETSPFHVNSWQFTSSSSWQFMSIHGKQFIATHVNSWRCMPCNSS